MRKNTEDRRKNKCKDTEGREWMANWKNCISQPIDEMQGALGGKGNVNKREFVW